MKCAIIDIGSNSMRLTIYDADSNSFKILLKEKTMAGLAGYIQDGLLMPDGIECACNGLLRFQEILELVQLDDVYVFATASLRNIENTGQVLAELRSATGYEVEIISGEDEALFGYVGAMQELMIDSGAFVDIGGASTELVTFSGGDLISAKSYPIGSLSLFRDCVKKLLPGKHSLTRIDEALQQTLGSQRLAQLPDGGKLACVGGTCRAVLRLCRSLFDTPEESVSLSIWELEELCKRLRRGDRSAIELILRIEPERIHTIVPGTLILRYIAKKLGARELVVSKYGVREGFLCQRVLPTI